MQRRRPHLAKLMQPRIHQTVARERLFEELDLACRSPLVWISGPPGSGKTTLVQSYLEAREIVPWWYQVDEGDRDPATLFHYLTALAMQNASGRKPRLPVASRELMAQPESFARRYFRPFFSAMPAGGMLVLDNYQDAQSDLLDRILGEFSDQAPPGVCVIAVSRADMGPALSRQLANRQLARIDWPLLRLTTAEVRAVAANLGELDATRVHRLEEISEGWAAGLVLLLSRSSAQAESQRPGMENKQALFDYFANETLRAAAPDVRDLLLRTSVMPSFSESMARALTGNPHAGQILQSLFRQQYFLDRRDDPEPVYQYHDLFREFLSTRFTHEVPERVVRECRANAAEILAVRSHVTEAIELYRLNGASDHVASLIRSSGMAYLERGQWQTVLDWYDAIPSQRVDADPWLQCILAGAIAGIDAQRAETLSVLAFERFSVDGNQDGRTAALGIAADVMGTLRQEVSKLEPWMQSFFGTAENRASFGLSRNLVIAWATWVNGVLYRSAESACINEGMRWLMVHVDSLPLGTNDKLFVYDSLLHCCIALADVPWGERLKDQIHTLLRRDDVSSVRRWVAIYSFGHWELACGRYAAAQYYFTEGASAARDQNLRDHAIANEAFLCIAMCVEGYIEQACERVRCIEDSALDSVSVRMARLASARCMMAHGDFRAAVGRLNAAIEQYVLEGNRTRLARCHAWLAICAIEMGSVRDAQTGLERAHEAIRGTIIQEFALLLAVVEAQVKHMEGQEHEAIVLLRRAVPLLANTVQVANLHPARRLLPALLELGLRHGVRGTDVDRLIRQWQICPDSPDPPHWPWQARVRTLGRFELEVNGAAPGYSRKPPARLLALLKAMIALGAQNVAESKLIEALWRDEEGDAAAKALNVAITRLRQLLGGSNTVEYADGVISLNRALVWVDAVAFEVGMNNGELAPTALDLYEGEFLPAELDAAWTITRRERLRSRFLQGVESQARALESQLQWEAASQLYLRGIETDPLFERLYQGLMQCYLQCGRKAEALGVYRRLRQTLSVVLGVMPSDTSEYFYRQAYET